MIQFDEHIFQLGWFNHQLDIFFELMMNTVDGRNPAKPVDK